jgi:TRAP-type C4-dicarboxylate transport system substrate-binding protein
MYEDDLAVQIWTYLGADVRVLGWADVYQSMQSGIVEAVTTPVALVESMKFYEQAPNIVRTNEYFQANAFLVNKSAYDGLKPETRDALVRAYDEVGIYSQTLMGEVADESLKRMEAKGATYKEIDTAPFAEKMRLFYQQKDKEGTLPKGFFEAVEATR